jgi:hypothetical protein
MLRSPHYPFNHLNIVPGVLVQDNAKNSNTNCQQFWQTSDRSESMAGVTCSGILQKSLAIALKCDRISRSIRPGRLRCKLQAVSVQCRTHRRKDALVANLFKELTCSPLGGGPASAFFVIVRPSDPAAAFAREPSSVASAPRSHERSCTGLLLSAGQLRSSLQFVSDRRTDERTGICVASRLRCRLDLMLLFAAEPHRDSGPSGHTRGLSHKLPPQLVRQWERHTGTRNLRGGSGIGTISY